MRWMLHSVRLVSDGIAPVLYGVVNVILVVVTVSAHGGMH